MKTLRSIYYASFDSNLRYACQVRGQIWGQNVNTHFRDIEKKLKQSNKYNI